VKVIYFIFSIYILSITVYPCGDDRDIALDQNSSAVSTAGHDHDAEQDFCSPFCICACCTAHIQIINVVAIAADNLVHNTELNTPYVERPVIDNGDSIWQPPKL
jgi:hypothetical protein